MFQLGIGGLKNLKYYIDQNNDHKNQIRMIC